MSHHSASSKHPKSAAFESGFEANDVVAYESVRDLEVGEDRYSEPSLRYIDVHERPTLVP